MKEGMTFSDWYRIQLHYSDTIVKWCWKRMIYKTEVLWQKKTIMTLRSGGK